MEKVKDQEKPLTYEQRLFQAAEFLYGASKLLEGVAALGNTREIILKESTKVLNILEDSMVEMDQSELDDLVNEIKDQ